MAKASFGSKVVKAILVVVLVIGAVGGYFAYKFAFKSNIYLDGKKSKIIFIRTGSTYTDLLEELYEQNTVVDHESFEWLANRMNLKENFKPGRYRVMAGMSNREFINLLKYGKQEKVKLTLTAADRSPGQLIEKISDKLEIDELELEAFFDDEIRIEEVTGLNKETIRTLFIPGTYELYWNTSFDDFIKLMKEQYKSVWNADRKAKAQKLGLSQSEVCILASIVQCESGIKSEQTKIAGVYLNRIKKGMPLQADPTLIYAVGDFSIQRVRNGDKDVDSPYNTYKLRGLPPGPICLVYVKTIDAVLDYKGHNYLYFCAKPDLSGYSDFSATYDQHLKYAIAYQKEMDKRGINR